MLCTLNGDEKAQKPRRNRQREADGTGQQRVSGLGADPQDKCRIPETGDAVFWQFAMEERDREECQKDVMRDETRWTGRGWNHGTNERQTRGLADSAGNPRFLQAALGCGLKVGISKKWTGAFGLDSLWRLTHGWPAAGLPEIAQCNAWTQLVLSLPPVSLCSNSSGPLGCGGYISIT